MRSDPCASEDSGRIEKGRYQKTSFFCVDIFRQVLAKGWNGVTIKVCKPIDKDGDRLTYGTHKKVS